MTKTPLYARVRWVDDGRSRVGPHYMIDAIIQWHSCLNDSLGESRGWLAVLDLTGTESANYRKYKKLPIDFEIQSWRREPLLPL